MQFMTMWLLWYEIPSNKFKTGLLFIWVLFECPPPLLRGGQLRPESGNEGMGQMLPPHLLQREFSCS